MIATLLSLMVCSSASAQEKPGFTARFLGWSPDSDDFAYVLTHHRRRPNRPGMRPPKDLYFMKRTSPSGVSQAMRLRSSVSARVTARGYQVSRVKGRRLSPFVNAFPVGNGRTLRVVLRLSKRRLWYDVWLDDVTRPGNPERLLRGFLKEVWTDFDTEAYMSPDRNWATIVFRMATPYRTNARVEGVRIRAKGAP